MVEKFSCYNEQKYQDNLKQKWGVGRGKGPNNQQL